MPISNVSSVIRNAVCSAYVSPIDSGSVNSNGKLEFYDSGDNLLVSADFSPTAFQAPSNGVAVANQITGGVGVAAGTIAYVAYKDRDNSECYRNSSVGLAGSGAEVIVSTLSVEIGSQLTVSSASFTVPAS